MKRLVSLITLAMLFALPAQAQTGFPGFVINFYFNPPVTTKVAVIPTVILEICGNSSCNAIAGAISLNCVAVQNAIFREYVMNACSTTAVMGPQGPNPTMAYLGRPVNVRLRMNGQVSQPFTFPGGTPALPAGYYKFIVAPGPGGFSVQPG